MCKLYNYYCVTVDMQGTFDVGPYLEHFDICYVTVFHCYPVMNIFKGIISKATEFLLKQTGVPI